MNVLLDVNVLLARLDVLHAHHKRVVGWFSSNRPASIVTCPITENGFVLIFSHPSYPTGPGNVEEAMFFLHSLREQPGHRFIADSLSLGHPMFSNWKSVKPAQLTDLYLLGLAVEHRLRFVTLNEGIDASRVAGGSGALVVIP